MALLVAQDIIEAGLEASYAAVAGGGDTLANPSDRRTFLHVKNAGSEMTVTVAPSVSTIATKGPWGILTRADIVVTIPGTTGDVMIGPFGDIFNDSSGLLNITYSSPTSVTIAAIRLP